MPPFCLSLRLNLSQSSNARWLELSVQGGLIIEQCPLNSIESHPPYNIVLSPFSPPIWSFGTAVSYPLTFTSWIPGQNHPSIICSTPPPPHLHFVISLLVELFSEQSITHEDLLLLLWYKTWLWIPPHPCKRNWEIMSWWWNIKYVIALFSPPKIKSSHSSVTADCQLPRSNNKDIQ